MRIGSTILEFITDILINRKLIIELTKREFKERYVSSYLGVLWAFIQPLVNVLVFWFVFEVGFRVRPTNTGLPYILWLISGLFPWYFFSDSVIGGTSAIVSKSFLVKKIVFPLRILPVIQILSALVINLFFNILLFLGFWMYGYTPCIYNIQIVYYIFASICLSLGIVLITSSIIVFVRDISPFINMCLQLLFWLTPVFWDIEFIPLKYRSILLLNPLAYIVNGYRKSFVTYEWLWNDAYGLIYFWVVTIFVLLIGIYTFNKLKSHFADVL